MPAPMTATQPSMHRPHLSPLLGLTNNTSYNFTVIATNTGGNSSPATEINATPIYVAPGITVTHFAGPIPHNTHDNGSERSWLCDWLC